VVENKMYLNVCNRAINSTSWGKHNNLDGNKENRNPHVSPKGQNYYLVNCKNYLLKAIKLLNVKCCQVKKENYFIPVVRGVDKKRMK
jgi:hypothetical protein